MSLAPPLRRATAHFTTAARHHHYRQPALTRSFFGLPSPFASSSSASTSDSPPPKGTLTRQGSIYVYQESLEMPYTQQQLYNVIADVDSYKDFLPFATDSSVHTAYKVSSDGRAREPQRVAEQGWLKGGESGEQWEMEAELKIGAMGFAEGYMSKVQTKKWESVAATAKDSSMFRHLVTSWNLTPTSTTPSPRTRVDLHLAYAFVSPFHAAAVSAVWEKVSGKMIGGFEKRVKDVYGSR